MNAPNMPEKSRRNGQPPSTPQQSSPSQVVVPLTRTEMHEPRTRYSDGWRAGKPAEDPEKLKKWGFISAKPSEFLIRIRGGNVVTAGQGATCFKWPWDSVAIIPTTVQRLHFTADQVTSEKVGVQVTGLAVYRIAEPLIAFRMLNYSFPERASEKLEQMLVEMFVGAARRLVANLTVEQCLTKRKEGLASELMKEIAPVVSGMGRSDDRTHKGWGVVIDTIEIQDVKVLSQQVFANMQARFRQEQERQAREAELAKDKALRQGEAEAERQIELARLAAQQEIGEKKRNADEQARLKAAAVEAKVAEAKLAQERALKEAEVANARKLALEKLQAELDVESRREQARMAHERALMESKLVAVQQEASVVQAQVDLALQRQALAQAELSIVELEQRRQQMGQELELSMKRALREIENTVSPEVIQLQVAQQLPKIAQAFQQQMGEVHVTSVDGANPFGYIAAAVEGVMGLARSAGLKIQSPVEGQAAKE